MLTAKLYNKKDLGTNIFLFVPVQHVHASHVFLVRFNNKINLFTVNVYVDTMLSGHI